MVKVIFDGFSGYTKLAKIRARLCGGRNAPLMRKSRSERHQCRLPLTT
jgi:hypothetical protein